MARVGRHVATGLCQQPIQPRIDVCVDKRKAAVAHLDAVAVLQHAFGEAIGVDDRSPGIEQDHAAVELVEDELVPRGEKKPVEPLRWREPRGTFPGTARPP